MKKLTAGIFATILGLTAVDAFAAPANTPVASTAYVKSAIQSLDSTATAQANHYISGVTMVDGKISQIAETKLPEYDDSGVKSRLDAIEEEQKQQNTNITNAANAAATADGKAVAAQSAAEAAAAAAATADGKAVAADGKAVAAQSAAEAADAKAQAAADAAAAADAKAVAADGKAVAAQNDVDALEIKVGTVPEGTTVVKMIEDAQSEATYDDTELSGRVTKNEADIADLKSGKADASSLGNYVTWEAVVLEYTE